MAPVLGKFPIEVFGRTYDDVGAEATDIRARQFCPYLQKECTKPRKSEPHIKVGICSLGQNSPDGNGIEPVIICPFRFLEDIVFQTIKARFFPDWENVVWTKEVKLGLTGNVDYVALKADADGRCADDFFCVEFQANGTTGTPYHYVKDLLENGAYAANYPGKAFGLNWANEFLKTMMQQVYKKGAVLDSWQRKLVFVIQDCALRYVESHSDASGLRNSMDDPVHFLTFKMVWNETANRFELQSAGWKSSDLDGIRKILSGVNADDYITEADFLTKAVKKAKSDGVLNE